MARDWLDDDGHFLWGKHKGEFVNEVGKSDPGYLRWALETDDVSDLDGAVIRAVLRGLGYDA